MQDISIDTIYSILSMRNPKLKTNEELKNAATSKKAFVLATGPSIKKQDLTLLAGKDCFSISNFFLHKDIQAINPILHFFIPYHEPLILEEWINVLNMADERLPKRTNIVLGYSSKEHVEKYNLFPKRKIYYLDFKSKAIWGVRTDLQKSILSPRNGPIMILPVLDYMGYEIINLVGCDTNTLKYYGGVVENFYDKDPRKNATDENQWSGIITQLEGTLKIVKQYKMYDDYFKRKKVLLQNLSPDSWLNFLQYKDFEKEVKDI